MIKLKKFGVKDRGKFAYTFYHWLAFQQTARKYHCWKPYMLFHDFWKPWLMLVYKGDYYKVQFHHRTHARHHIEYRGNRGYDYLGMVIDWECSHLTKKDKPFHAVDEWKCLTKKNKITPEMSGEIEKILRQIKLLK